MLLSLCPQRATFITHSLHFGFAIDESGLASFKLIPRISTWDVGHVGYVSWYFPMLKRETVSFGPILGQDSAFAGPPGQHRFSTGHRRTWGRGTVCARPNGGPETAPWKQTAGWALRQRCVFDGWWCSQQVESLKLMFMIFQYSVDVNFCWQCRCFMASLLLVDWWTIWIFTLSSWHPDVTLAPRNSRFYLCPPA